MKKAIYPGTFDPPTKGHEDIALRSLEICDELIIGIGNNSAKNILFSIEERMSLWCDILSNHPQITILPFTGLIVNFAQQQDASIIIRGLRAISDFEYELQMAETNRTLNPEIDTIFFTAKGRQLFVSSSIVKEISFLGGDVSDKASPIVCKALVQKFNKN